MTIFELNKKLSELIHAEREITNEILALINMGFEQRAYLELGFSSMFDWLTRGFGYSNGSAQRRIEAARFLQAVPVVAEKLEKGEVTLSTVSRVQTIIKEHEKNVGAKVSSSEKLDVLKRVENKTIVETEKILVSLFPDVKSTVAQERRFIIDENTTRHSMNLSKEISSDLKRAKEVLSHIFPKGSDAEIIGYALKFLLDKKDPLRKDISSSVQKSVPLKVKKIETSEAKTVVFDESESTSAAEVRRPEVSYTGLFKREDQRLFPSTKKTQESFAASKRRTLNESQGACTFKDPITGRTCNSRYQVQIDHVQPKAMGGLDVPKNLRVLCRQHNLLMAERAFGKQKMQIFRKGL